MTSIKIYIQYICKHYL